MILLVFFFFCFTTLGGTVTIACDSLGKKKEQCVKSVKEFEKLTGHTVKIVEAPTGSSNRLTWAQQQLASGSDSVDVYQIDAPWASLLETFLVPIPLSADEREDYHPLLIENNTVGGKTMALPWYLDIGLLFYRKDLLEKYGYPVPSTWEELEHIATKIQEKEREVGHDKIWGYVFAGKAFEGLSCHAGEWIRSYKDAHIIDPDGNVKVNTPQSAAILNRVAGWIGKIVPLGALNYAEEDSRGVFQSGNAVFMRHWPYVLALSEAPDSLIRGKVGVTLLPKGDRNGVHASTLGGWQLAIAKSSKNKELAIQLVKFLAGNSEMKRRAIEGGYYPTRPALYNDPHVRKALPQAELIQEGLDYIIARPSAQTGRLYNQVSSAIWGTVHEILLGKEKAEEALTTLEKKIKMLLRRKKK